MPKYLRHCLSYFKNQLFIVGLIKFKTFTHFLLLFIINYVLIITVLYFFSKTDNLCFKFFFTFLHATNLAKYDILFNPLNSPLLSAYPPTRRHFLNYVIHFYGGQKQKPESTVFKPAEKKGPLICLLNGALKRK